MTFQLIAYKYMKEKRRIQFYRPMGYFINLVLEVENQKKKEFKLNYLINHKKN